MSDVPTFTLRADDPDALQALYALGSLKEKPSKGRDQVLDACLEFSRWRDEQDALAKTFVAAMEGPKLSPVHAGMGSDPGQR